jgi:hypothetical protein
LRQDLQLIAIATNPEKGGYAFATF